MKLLIANRGEIACRVARSARAMGIETVAVFSDADADAEHVRAMDLAVRIGPAPSRDSYLSVPRLLEAAKRVGATAVHPGYGFLSENAGFATACVEAGLLWVGPPPSAIEKMGKKREAKQIARAAEVPVVPGYDGEDQSVERFRVEAELAGYPVLVKASAGGGGKGMRIVRGPAELPDAVEGARREALAAFGDDALLLEKYIEEPRHIELQILGDKHGNLVHLFERECSIQRRHQKIVEESPSTAVSPRMREEMGAAALRLARAIGYENAGTVEFIVDPLGRYYFLEVNTRLQVEHPVTEAVTGLDLVREQLRIARGEPLGYTQSELRQRGHAIEVRLYAESPAKGFLPASGTLVDFDVPSLPGLRVDGGVRAGQEVSIHYDPLLAKLITHAPTRGEAIDRMLRALALTSAQGIDTNLGFLARVLDHPAHRAGHVHTHFIEQHLAAPTPLDPALLREAAVAATAHAALARAAERTQLTELVPGFRNNRGPDAVVEWSHEAAVARVAYRWLGARTLWVQPEGEAGGELRVTAHEGPRLVFEEGAVVREARVVRAGDHAYVRTRLGALSLAELPRFPEKKAAIASGSLCAPMPGRVVLVKVAVGDAVEAGAVLVVLEAMKMEHTVRAPEAGVVRELRVAAGEQVKGDQVLVVVSAPDTQTI